MWLFSWKMDGLIRAVPIIFAFSSKTKGWWEKYVSKNGVRLKFQLDFVLESTEIANKVNWEEIENKTKKPWMRKIYYAFLFLVVVIDDVSEAVVVAIFVACIAIVALLLLHCVLCCVLEEHVDCHFHPVNCCLCHCPCCCIHYNSNNKQNQTTV